MQKAEVVLSVLRERGRRGLPLTQLYRQMFNKDLYLLAYGNIYSNEGAMTPGTGGETADGMSEEKIEEIAELMRQERYRFSPARRTYIPKKNGKLRPLGIPSWSDKLVGEVVRLLLEAYYEPGFSDRSHGFRKGRGCHTALREIRETWSGTTWFIEGDIRDCFGSLDQEILAGILAEKIHDQRFLRLMRNMLRAGYLEDWEYHETLSGCPQGGVVSPAHVLATPSPRSTELPAPTSTGPTPRVSMNRSTKPLSCPKNETGSDRSMPVACLIRRSARGNISPRRQSQNDHLPAARQITTPVAQKPWRTAKTLPSMAVLAVPRRSSQLLLHGRCPSRDKSRRFPLL